MGGVILGVFVVFSVFKGFVGIMDMSIVRCFMLINVWGSFCDYLKVVCFLYLILLYCLFGVLFYCWLLDDFFWKKLSIWWI